MVVLVVAVSASGCRGAPVCVSNGRLHNVTLFDHRGLRHVLLV